MGQRTILGMIDPLLSIMSMADVQRLIIDLGLLKVTQVSALERETCHWKKVSYNLLNLTFIVEVK